MRQCGLCNKELKNWVFVDGKLRNLCNRKYCLNCSPFKKHNTRKLEVPKKSFYYNVKNHRRRMKLKALEYLGGKCFDCGYDKCKRALSFHHNDAGEKDFSISANYNKAWDTIRRELDKCIILCANCHMEHHERKDKALSSTVEQAVDNC